ncbi:hypothetical protein MGN70_003033 [Eutypa lata]|nr:hypothetical protein MGN70_003033 [Eutypa lata]
MRQANKRAYQGSPPAPAGQPDPCKKKKGVKTSPGLVRDLDGWAEKYTEARGMHLITEAEARAMVHRLQRCERKYAEARSLNDTGVLDADIESKRTELQELAASIQSHRECLQNVESRRDPPVQGGQFNWEAKYRESQQALEQTLGVVAALRVEVADCKRSGAAFEQEFETAMQQFQQRVAEKDEELSDREKRLDAQEKEAARQLEIQRRALEEQREELERVGRAQDLNLRRNALSVAERQHESFRAFLESGVRDFSKEMEHQIAMYKESVFPEQGGRGT